MNMTPLADPGSNEERKPVVLRCRVMRILNSDNELLKDRGFLVAVAVAALGVVCLVGLVWNHG
jgi:hypothetical protein